MAQVWLRDDTRGWAPVELNSSDCQLVEGRPVAVSPEEAGTSIAAPLLCREGEQWLVLAGESPAVRVNGRPLMAGLRLLRDRDAVAFVDPQTSADITLFFSTEQLVQILPLPDDRAGTVCPRCRQGIDVGSPAVRCPECGTWHDETPQRNCWTYAATCAVCGATTDLAAGYRWTPEEL